MLPGGTQFLALLVSRRWCSCRRSLSVCRPKRSWFNVFSVQLDSAAASAPRLGAGTCVAQATAETLEGQNVQIKLSFADFHQILSSRCR